MTRVTASERAASGEPLTHCIAQAAVADRGRTKNHTESEESAMLSWMRHPSGRPVLPRLALLVFAATAAVACDDDPTDPDTLTWEAELEGVGEFDEVAGIAEVVSGAASFVAGIEIADAPADAELSWTVRAGTCAAPGTAVGPAASYPALEVDGDGDADAQANIAASLDEEDDYIVFVSDESGDASVTVACGALAVS